MMVATFRLYRCLCLLVVFGIAQNASGGPDHGGGDSGVRNVATLTAGFARSCIPFDPNAAVDSPNSVKNKVQAHLRSLGLRVPLDGIPVNISDFDFKCGSEERPAAGCFRGKSRGITISRQGNGNIAATLIHEYGHAVDAAGFRDYNSNWCSNPAMTVRTTENKGEQFAEVFAAYVLAPSRLRAVCPQAYDYMHQKVFNQSPGTESNRTKPECNSLAVASYGQPSLRGTDVEHGGLVGSESGGDAMTEAAMRNLFGRPGNNPSFTQSPPMTSTGNASLDGIMQVVQMAMQQKDKSSDTQEKQVIYVNSPAAIQESNPNGPWPTDPGQGADQPPVVVPSTPSSAQPQGQ